MLILFYFINISDIIMCILCEIVMRIYCVSKKGFGLRFDL